jgi:hypothetical protein
MTLRETLSVKRGHYRFLGRELVIEPSKQEMAESHASHFPFVCVGWVLLIVFATPALAQERGVYSLGSTLTEAGTLPDPGFSYSNQIWYGAAGQLKGPQGNSLPVNLSAALVADNNSLMYVPKFKFLKANLEFILTVTFTNGSYSAIDPFIAGHMINVSGEGLTDTNIVPFELGWQFKRVDFQTGYNFYFPTGHFDPSASDNTSNGFWTNSWHTGATIYLTKTKATQISIYNAYAWNTAQKGTHFHPGQNDSIDYSVSQKFLLSKSGKWGLLVGAAGYGQWQTSNNRGSDPIRDALRYRVNAGGFTLSLSSPLKGLYLATGALWEYGARSTFQGHTMTITGGFQF